MLRIRRSEYPLLNDKEWIYEKYWREKLSPSEIADVLGCSCNSVRRGLKRHGIETRSQAEAMLLRIKEIKEHELRYWYDIKERTQQEIGDYYGVNRATIQNRMKEYGIKPRTISESVKGNANARGTRKYCINEDFFKTWTQESAWLYGWGLGDGNYTGKEKGERQ